MSEDRPLLFAAIDFRTCGVWERRRGLVLAARQLGLVQVPAVTITDLDQAKLRLLRLALNRLSEDLAGMPMP